MDLCLSGMSPIQIYSLLLTQEMGVFLAGQRMKTLKYQTISSIHLSSQNISTIHFSTLSEQSCQGSFISQNRDIVE